MRFLRDALITIVVLVLVVWVIVYVRLRAGALTADAEPGGVERAVASRLVRLSIPADADRQQNPFAANPTAWRDAAEHYEDHCATCHGRDGHGKTEMGPNMYPKVPDLADQGIQRFSDGALFYIIQNGVRWTGMPAWKNEHSAEETWKLVSFIRKIPSLTPQELESLEKESHKEKESGQPNQKPTRHEHKHSDSSRTPR